MRDKSTPIALNSCLCSRRIWSFKSRRIPFGQIEAAQRRRNCWQRTLMLALGITFCLSIQLPAEAVAQLNEMSPSGDRSGGYTAIDSTQLSGMLDDSEFFFVNVHIPYEGEIDGTDSLIPFNEIAENIDEFPSDKREKIVLYCKSGRMSELAAQELSRLGYSNVFHLVGGMIDWQKSGHAIIRK